YADQPKSGNGKLEVKGGDRITVTYVDQLADEGRPNQVRAATVDVLSGGDGSPTGPATLNAGDTLTLTLTDMDLSKNSGGSNDTFDLEVQSSSGDRLMAHFQETATEGRFTAQVPTEFGEKPISGDTKLQVKGGDAVTATYVDALDATGRANVSREYRAKVNGGGTATPRFLDSGIRPG